MMSKYEVYGVLSYGGYPMTANEIAKFSKEDVDLKFVNEVRDTCFALVNEGRLLSNKLLYGKREFAINKNR